MGAGDSDKQRDVIDEAIQSSSTVPGAMLTGWVVISEWMDASGQRWLSKGHAASKAPWEANGMMHEALYGDWPREG